MISVIICTHNRAELLKDVLVSFFQQTHLDQVNAELIVVDNASSDGTASVVKGYIGVDGSGVTTAGMETGYGNTDSPAASGQPAGRPLAVPVRYVFEARQGLSIARNRGIQEADGDIVAFLDDDVILDAEWLWAMVRCFQQTGADAVGGRSRLVFEADRPRWLVGDFRKSLSEADLGDDRLVRRDGAGLYGLNMAFRKEPLLAVGGFNEQLGRQGGNLLAGEELEVFNKIAANGGTIVYEPAACLGHRISENRLRWSYIKGCIEGHARAVALFEPAGPRWRELVGCVRSAAGWLVALQWPVRAMLLRYTWYDAKKAQVPLINHRARFLVHWQRFFRAH